MPELLRANFLDTLIRMYNDTKLLYENEEFYNCCYLAGYVLECALKYLLISYCVQSDGTPYDISAIKKFSHKNQSLNKEIETRLSLSEDITSRYRMNPGQLCPYIFNGSDGYPEWNPKYRYGEHPKWESREWAEQYIQEVENIFQFISNIRIGGR